MTTNFATTDDTNDLFLDNAGNISVVDGLQAVLYACASAARTKLGECVLQVDYGIPFEETVWLGVPQIAQYQAALRQALQQVDGVQQVLSLNVARVNAQTLGYTAVIQTDFGQGNLGG